MNTAARQKVPARPEHDTPPNRLSGETSPYLLQHAYNPVDWYPWGEEAFERARQENKPLFLSVGYAACHWCHVMERESFENRRIADFLNAHFIPIKVDREEHPEVDEIYMTAVQAMTGHGGWPLSVFLTPAGEPFFGGTYFPPEDRHGIPSFQQVLQAIHEAWETRPRDIGRSAKQITKTLQRDVTNAKEAPESLDISVLDRAAGELARDFDPEWGGFGPAPKFPPSGAISLLLRQYSRTGKQLWLDMATRTLDRMARGGLYDQLGGGFHRYSVDAFWQIPHFEKMLYDNALLSRVYLEAWQVTGNPLYRRVARETLDYVLRDMTDPRGGFHCSEDADSEGEEGKFYVWTQKSILDVLGEEDGKRFCSYYGVSSEGNFQGRNILHIPRDPETVAREFGITPDTLEDHLAPLRQKLFDQRSKRVRPAKDDKVLAAWNGMMISALARGSEILDEERYLHAARWAAEFVLGEMVHDGILLRSYRGPADGNLPGLSKLPGYLDDYAEMAAGLIDLYEAGGEARWLQAARDLADKMIADFWDQERGGFYYTSAIHKNLLVRTKPFYDSAVPSGNTTALKAILRLAILFDNPEHHSRARQLLSVAASDAARVPRAYLDLLCEVDFAIRPTRTIVLVGEPDSQDTRELLRAVHDRFLPNRILAWAISREEESAWDRLPLVAGKKKLSDQATAYVCEGTACLPPVQSGKALETLLGSQPR